MRASEMRDLGVQELKDKETALRQELFNLRFQKATGQLGNSAMLGKVRKDLARVKTVLRELEAAAS